MPEPQIEDQEDSDDNLDQSTDDSELDDANEEIDEIEPFRPELGIYLPEKFPCRKSEEIPYNAVLSIIVTVQSIFINVD